MHYSFLVVSILVRILDCQSSEHDHSPYINTFVQKCVCGTSKVPKPSNSKVRIVGGHDYSPHRYPWLVYLQLNNTFLCGGSIISDRYVLSAAHCVKNRSSKKILKVVTGDHNRCQHNGRTTVISVDAIIPHPRYNAESFAADIMLLKLGTRITFNNFVKPICLPSFDINRNVVHKYKGKMATVIGWGKTSENLEKPSCLPKQVQLPILSRNDCGGDVSYSLFCAGYISGGTDACQGDSGGPLQIQNKKNRAVLIGIVSNGIGCALPRHPGLYTDVLRYLPWIYEQTTDSLHCW